MKSSTPCHCFVVSLLLILAAAIPAQLIAEETTALVIATAPDPGQQMHEHLQTLDRRLRLRLLRVADQEPVGGPDVAVSEDEVQRYRRHLRSLEDRLRAWDGDQAATLIRKVRALQPLVENLARAAEHPETAAAGLAGLCKALRVEWPPAPDLKASANDDCADAIPIGDGTYFGDTSDDTPDGESCHDGSPDVWFAYSSPETVEVVADTFGSGFDTVLSVHTGCPGTHDNQIACNDDTFGSNAAVSFEAQAGVQYLIRVAGFGSGGAGSFALNIGPAGVISGKVTDAITGEPIAAVELEASNELGYRGASATSDADGDYAFSGMKAGIYFVHTAETPGYLREIYDDLPCHFHWGCQPELGTPIEVVSGATTGEIDFALHRGGTISGAVTEAATGDPLSGLSVGILDSQGEVMDYVYTSSSGLYSLPGLYAGTYYAMASSDGHRCELYDDIPCQEGLDPTTGTPIEVGFGATTGGVDFALNRLGVITGNVSDSATGYPIPSATIRVWDGSGWQVRYTLVDDTGSYRLGLSPGSYFLTTDTYEHFDELYDDLPCEPGCDPAAGTPIEVGLDTTTAGIDFVLKKLGAIAGSVTHTLTGEPIPSARVSIWDGLGNRLQWLSTNSAGNYISEGLVPGNYTVTASHDDYVGELFDDLPCHGDDCDPAAGTPVAVSLDTVTAGIDFALDQRPAISGRVTHTLTSQPLPNTGVVIYSASGSWLGSAVTDTSGYYLARVRIAGSHFAVAGHLEYLDEVYDDIPCEEDCDPTIGSPIATSLNTVTVGVDFALDRLGEISGWVTRADTGAPLTWASVSIYDSSGTSQQEAVVGVGDYSARGLAPGIYFARARHSELENQLYDGIPCERFCDPTSGTPITVRLNEIAAGIDFALRPLPLCEPTETSLCLAGDRFRVEASWEDYQHVTGRGFAETLTADAGYFWFFNPGNIELVVKVLDVCVDPHHHFWVFGAGLTDVGVELTVIDELNGLARTYSSPLGSAFEPVLDTLAFATCDVASAPSSSALWQPPSWTGRDKTACTPSAIGLCLNAGRFLVEVLWEAPNGDGGSAQAVQMTGDAGYFWFGSVDNVEVVVKVLDACGLAPFHNYWVFAAGLTNFEVTLRVTDTESGEIREYSNSQGTTFQAITDTGAFATCS